ncbi:uncharacterized protein CC84DRAFT_630521 [Paraphaeosphaeria sporulosa]|uniref:Uncharacterized protein n=1 Tax=Paraphaeosphaeria sporulosa TaxID=1460663 RepID=A0A177CJE3_9PLEO|nr:uncharacterized protein CC84DRAFT_630521 [Paraphaeosphaeria sporulosa]OAG06907.1 hypothetical protein CC84DRAFT_630521 [Paraphaeosphaeria sporulosa]
MCREDDSHRSLNAALYTRKIQSNNGKPFDFLLRVNRKWKHKGRTVPGESRPTFNYAYCGQAVWSSSCRTGSYDRRSVQESQLSEQVRYKVSSSAP